MYTNDVRQRCSSLRRAGHSLNEIAEAGWRKVKFHTYDSRIQQMLEVMKLK